MKLIKIIQGWLRALTTGKDGSTPDAIRIGAIIMGTQFVLLASWHVMVLSKDFDPQSYGLGAASLLAATGAALGMAHRTMPDPE